jgi:hypothetical protein
MIMKMIGSLQIENLLCPRRLKPVHEATFKPGREDGGLPVAPAHFV